MFIYIYIKNLCRIIYKFNSWIKRLNYENYFITVGHFHILNTVS